MRDLDVTDHRRPPIRIVLADDAYLLREALKHLLDTPTTHVVGECDDARAVPELLDRSRADLLISDIRMPPSGEDEGIRLAVACAAAIPRSA